MSVRMSSLILVSKCFSSLYSSCMKICVSPFVSTLFLHFVHTSVSLFLYPHMCRYLVALCDKQLHHVRSEPNPDSCRNDLLLGKAQSVSDTGYASVRADLRKGKTALHNSNREREVRNCREKQHADMKVSAERGHEVLTVERSRSSVQTRRGSKWSRPSPGSLWAQRRADLHVQSCTYAQCSSGCGPKS